MKLTIALILGISAWAGITRLVYYIYCLCKDVRSNHQQVESLIQTVKQQGLQIMHLEALIQKLRHDLGDEAS